MATLLQLFGIKETPQDAQVLRSLLLKVVVRLKQLLFVVSVQNPVVVAQHEVVAALHGQFVANLDFSLHGPLVHLQPQIHRTINCLIVEIFRRNSLVYWLELVGSVQDVESLHTFLDEVQPQSFSDDLLSDQLVNASDEVHHLRQ